MKQQPFRILCECQGELMGYLWTDDGRAKQTFPTFSAAEREAKRLNALEKKSWARRASQHGDPRNAPWKFYVTRQATKVRIIPGLRYRITRSKKQKGKHPE